VIARPKKKGKFSQKSADGETGERHVPPAVQAYVDGMGDVGTRNTLLHSALVRTRDTWQKRIL
jgi:hypothetical protein